MTLSPAGQSLPEEKTGRKQDRPDLRAPLSCKFAAVPVQIHGLKLLLPVAEDKKTSAYNEYITQKQTMKAGGKI